VSLADETASFLHLSGAYSTDIIVGDFAYVPVQFSLGTASLTFPAKPSPDQAPLYTKSLLHTSDNTLAPLAEISHQMRSPDTRASGFMATIFSSLVAVPLVVFVGFVMSKTSNLSRMSASGALFYLCVVGVLGMYLSYWFSLPGFSFYETIQYMFFVLPSTYVLGRAVLASMEVSRGRELTGGKKKN
jgi:hypothetical protein